MVNWRTSVDSTLSLTVIGKEDKDRQNYQFRLVRDTDAAASE